MRRIALLLGMAVLAGACARAPEAGSGLVLFPQGGQVQLQRDGEWRVVANTVSLLRGDRVRVGDFGHAVLELPGGTLELRDGSAVRVAPIPELESGSLLARATPALTVGVGAVRVRAENSVYRLDQALSLRVGVYRGEVSLPGSGWDDTVPALRQVVLVGGTVPRGPVALQVDPEDPWDDRLLGEAIEVGRQLERFQEGVAFQLPRRGGKGLVAKALPLDHRAVLPGVSRSDPVALSEALVASVIASTAASTRQTSPESAYQQVMALRQIGASWMVVAAEWRLAHSVLEALVQVANLLTRDLAPASTGESARQTGGGSGGGSSSSAGGSGGGGTGSGGGGGGGGSTEEPSPPPGCTDLLNCTVEEVLEVPEVPGDLVP